eukprot:jgi/Botrbrau1/16871/Bobra.150_2s0090.1
MMPYEEMPGLQSVPTLSGMGRENKENEFALHSLEQAEQMEALFRDFTAKRTEPAEAAMEAARVAYNISASSASRPAFLPAIDAGQSQPANQLDPKAFVSNERVDPKTQICFDFTKGVCARGASCKYSHDLDLIVRVNSQERGVCFDFLRGQCQRGQLCRFSHDISNITAQQGQWASKGKRNAPICYDFVKGQCLRAAECRYSHDITSIINSTKGVHNSSSNEICYDFTRGRCARGSNCRYSHDMSKSLNQFYFWYQQLAQRIPSAAAQCQAMFGQAGFGVRRRGHSDPGEETLHAAASAFASQMKASPLLVVAPQPETNNAMNSGFGMSAAELHPVVSGTATPQYEYVAPQLPQPQWRKPTEMESSMESENYHGGPRRHTHDGSMDEYNCYHYNDIMQQMLSMQITKTNVETIPEWTTAPVSNNIPYTSLANPVAVSVAPPKQAATPPVPYQAEAVMYSQSMSAADPHGHQGPAGQSSDLLQNIRSLQDVAQLKQALEIKTAELRTAALAAAGSVAPSAQALCSEETNPGSKAYDHMLPMKDMAYIRVNADARSSSIGANLEAYHPNAQTTSATVSTAPMTGLSTFRSIWDNGCTSNLGGQRNLPRGS